MKTKCGDVNARFPRGIQQGRPIIQGNVPSIDSQLEHINPQSATYWARSHDSIRSLSGLKSRKMPTAQT
jgi:hypothetical protein